MTLIKTFLILTILNSVLSQLFSPCPNILMYETTNSETDRWYAVVNLSTRESLKGLWLTISLDRPAKQLGNIFGDAATSNNIDFLIRSSNYVLEAGTVTPVRFFVKYNSGSGVPRVSEINLNGRIICSAAKEQTTSRTSTRPTSNSLQTHNQQGSSNSNHRQTTSNQGSVRPSRPSNTNSRPSYDDSDLARPNTALNSNSRLPNDDSRPSRPSTPNSRPTYDDLEIARPNIASSSNHRLPNDDLRPSRPSNINSRPTYDDLELARPNTASTSNSRPSNDNLEVGRPNRLSNSNLKPTSFGGDTQVTKPNNRTPSRHTGSSGSNDDSQMSNRRRPSNANSRPSVDDIKPTGSKRVSNNGYRPTNSTEYENTRLNHASNANIGQSSFTDDLEIGDSYKHSRPTGYTEDLEIVTPSRPVSSSIHGNNRPDRINTEAAFSGTSSHEGSNFYSNRFNVDSTHSSNPIDEFKRKPEDYGGGTSYNHGSPVQQENEDFFAGDFSAIVSRPPSNPSTQRTAHKDHRCGVVAAQPRPLISYGQDTEPGQWPWHAALYHSKGIQLMYTCGGTLISTNHIITAAHCVTKPRTNRPINSQDILAYLGKHNLRKFGSEIQDREIGDIFLHPEYNYSGYYNDIAILRLAEPVEITNYVRPICLWDKHTDLNEVEGKLGTVVGWGFNENGVLTTTLMQSQMPIVSLAKCIYSNRDFFSQFTSEKSFCAGFRNGSSVCNGDSGGGMVFPRSGTGGSNTVWQIRGVVSVGVAFQGKIICDTSQYVVFSDVAKHLDWIETILNNYP